jgi:1-phosphofructokinase family hexose kinase
MKIYTLTLNPAYDVHAFAKSLTLNCENLAQIESREAGGKGVNISRALCNGQIPNTAIVVLGKENGDEFKNSISDMDCVLLEKEGRIRENLTFHLENGTETRISFSGFPVDDSIFEEVLDNIEIEKDTIVTFTGRIPAGVGKEKAKEFLKILNKYGMRIVLDSKSFTIEDIFEIKPWLIKPNQEEISEYLGCEIKTLSEVLEKAAVFTEHGITNTMVTLGEQGAALLTEDKVYIATCPVIDAISTIGAGDSTIAGFLAGTYAGEGANGCLKTAVSFGTAACLTAGTLPPQKEDIDKIYAQISVTEEK